MKRPLFAAITLLLFLSAGTALADKPRKPDAKISARRQTIKKGESTVLSWNTACATATTVGTDKRFYTHRRWIGIKYRNWEQLNPAFPHSGSMVVCPKETTRYYVIGRRREIDFNNNDKADGIRRAKRDSVKIKVKK